MRAMRIVQPGPIENLPLVAAEVPRPTPAGGQVCLRVQVCGICHTDLHEAEGELPEAGLPRIPGHQIVGRVVERGPGAERFAIGARVGVAWLHSTCGACAFCADGRENLCPHARFTGHDVDGGYAEYACVPQEFAYALPGAFSDEAAAPLLCAGIIGYRALRLCEVRPGQRLGLFGFGASAHLAIQVARHWGCEVHVFSRSEEHRALARDLGAASAGPAEAAPHAGLHAAVIFAPAGGLVPVALRALERGGTLALAGIHMSRIPALDYREHLYFERTVRSVANATRRDGEEFLDLAARASLRIHTTAFPLEQANEALGLLKQGRISGAGVLRVGDSA